MKLELLTAIRFEKVMSSGRTQPCLLICENEAGAEVELVVKMRGHPQIMPGGLMAEAMASLLALDLDLPVQQPYRVKIEQEFAETVPMAALREVFTGSVGLELRLREVGTGLHDLAEGQNALPRNEAGRDGDLCIRRVDSESRSPPDQPELRLSGE